ncbi:MAG TPA: hypothetical protein QF753_11325 [Victivallales bacterium]|nr:hypothetical protein [Victivallales bacterium]
MMKPSKNIKKMLTISAFTYFFYSSLITVIGLCSCFTVKLDQKYYLYGIIIILISNGILILSSEIQKAIRRIKGLLEL